MRVIYDYQITLVTTLVISYFRIEIIKMQYLRYYIHWFLKKKGIIYTGCKWIQRQNFFIFWFFVFDPMVEEKSYFFPSYWIQLYLCLEIILDLNPLFYINEAYILAHIIIWNKAKFPSDFHLQYCCETELFFFHIYELC